MLKSEPYWWESAGRPTSPPDVALPKAVDVLVIGAGLTGLAAARILARKGRSVLVLDAMAPGEGASSRNGGMIGGGHRLSTEALIRQFGSNIARDLLYEAHCASRDFTLHLMDDDEIACDYVECGRFRGLWTTKEYDEAGRALDRLKAMVPVDAHMVPDTEQRAEAGTDLYSGGVVYPLHGSLNPAKWVGGLLKAAERAGACVQGKTPVLDLRKNGASYTAATSRGSIEARDVLLATNGYTSAAFAQTKRRIVPLPSYIITSEPLPPETINSIFPKRRMVAESRERHCYYRPSPDGQRLVFGGRAAMFEAPDWIVERELKRLIREIYPDLGTIGFSHLWRGKTGFTFSFLPHVGRIDGIWHAIGYCGSGNAMAPWLGHKAGLLIAGDPEGATAFQKTPFPTRFWHRGYPWFLPFADLLFRGRDIWNAFGRKK
ncbi:MAG: FAD-binding oxidoreductase [Pseudomonadota bacterium]